MMLSQHIRLLYRALRYRYRVDTNEIRYMMQHIHKKDVVLDVGAHMGGYTFWMQKAVGSKGLVVAFEPQPEGAALLQKIFRKNVRVEMMAFSDEQSARQLFIQPQQHQVSFEASLEKNYDQARIVTVDTTTIDHYCRVHSLAPSFIKIDVEGHEQQVIHGAMDVLKKYKPALLVECEARHIGIERMDRLFHQLAQSGYNGFFFFRGKRLPISQFNVSVHQSTSQLNKGSYSNNFIFE